MSCSCELSLDKCMWPGQCGRIRIYAAQIGEPMKRYEVIPIHTPPVETPIEPKAPVVNPEKVEPEKVE